MPVSEGMWASIESQIPVKKERPKIWIFFLLCAAAIPLYVISLSHGKQTVDEKIVAEVATKKTTLTAKEKLSNQSSTETKNNINTSFGIVNESLADNRNAQKNLVSDNESNSTISINERAIETLSTNSQLDNKNAKKSTNKSKVSLSSSSLLSSSSTKKLKFVNNPFRKTLKAGGVNSLKLIEKSRMYKGVSKMSKITPLTRENVLSKIFIDAEKRAESYCELMSNERTSVAACPSFAPYYSGIYFFGEVNVGQSIQNLSTSNRDLLQYIQARHEGENGALSVSATVGVGKEWRSGLIFETGINYDRIKLDVATDRRREVIEIVNGDTVVVNVQLDQLQNTFTQINVPVIFGYKMHLSNRFSAVGKAGILVNLNSRNEGQIMDEEGNIVSYNSDSVASSMFRTNLGLSYTSSLLVEGVLNSHFSAYAGLNANFYPSNFSLSSQPIRQTYSKFGMTAGIKYSL